MLEHTFVVLAYGDSPYLGECLASLAQQTVRSVVLVATSTPSDHIQKTASQYGARIRSTDAGLGIAHDWNFGLLQAETQFVTLAHQDDTYLPNYTERCLNAAKGNVDTLICFPDYAELEEGEIRPINRLLRVKRSILRIGFAGSASLRCPWRKRALIALGSPIPAPGVMYNLSRLSAFRFSDQYFSNLDWDAWYRMAAMDGSFVYVREVLMYHRIHRESATTASIKENIRLKEDASMFRRIWPAPVARAITWLYKGSYRSNRLEP